MNHTDHDALDANDQRQLRHGRDQHVGFPIGHYSQTPPMLFTRDGHNVFLGDLYRGYSAFLVCGGPSLRSHDLTRLDQRGILTLGVNNAAAVYRPQLWVSVDHPCHFCDAIWTDPGILKFIPLDHMEKAICVRDRSGQLTPSRDRVGDMPGVFGFRRNEQFVAEQWLYESTFNWGHHSQRRDAYGHKGSRSVFYVALRLLFFLGVRTVYLLGCDFRMEVGRANYAFDQDRTPASIRGNNATYRILNARLRHLLPYFEKEGFRVFNCTPNSGLTVFPPREYHEALDHATNHISRHLITTGMYTYQPAHATRKSAGKEFSPSGVPRSGLRIPRSMALPLTVVVGWTPRTDTQLVEALRTWICAFSGCAEVPLLVVHASDAWPKWTSESQFPDRSDSVTLVPGGRCGDHTMPEIDLVSVACTAETPWVLILPEPFRLASGAVGIHPEWFVGPYVDYLTDHQSRVVSAKMEEQIHAWTQTVPSLYRFRGENRSISALSGPFLARTHWLRGLKPILASAPPTIPRSLILGAITARRGDAGRKVDWRTAGWEICRGANRNRDERNEL